MVAHHLMQLPGERRQVAAADPAVSHAVEGRRLIRREGAHERRRRRAHHAEHRVHRLEHALHPAKRQRRGQEGHHLLIGAGREPPHRPDRIARGMREIEPVVEPVEAGLERQQAGGRPAPDSERRRAIERRNGVEHDRGHAIEKAGVDLVGGVGGLVVVGVVLDAEVDEGDAGAVEHAVIRLLRPVVVAAAGVVAELHGDRRCAWRRFSSGSRRGQRPGPAT